MAQDKPANPDGKGTSALDREADRVDGMMNTGADKHGEAGRQSEEAARGMNNPVQVEQDNRVDKARADAKAAGGGPDKPEAGLNQDG